MNAPPSHATRPSSDLYDTLDDVDDKHAVSLKQVYSAVFGGIERYAGVVISGGAALSDASAGYWGRAFSLESGEYIQVRICPKGSFGKPLQAEHTRVVAVRRSGLNSPPRTSFAVLFAPRKCPASAITGTLSCGKTAGCRGLHILLPSLFSKHQSVRDKDNGFATIDLMGFHSIRPYTFTISNSVVCDGHRIHSTTSVAPGIAYVTIAGHLAGHDTPDPLVRSHIDITDDKYRTQVGSVINTMSKKVGENLASECLSSALTIIELLSAEGLLMMLSHSFFDGVLPDTVHAPGGMPLLVVMSCRVALLYDTFGLPSPTPVDKAANQELRMMFESRWKPFASGSYAIDLAMKNGVDSAHVRMTEIPPMKLHYSDNLIFWQRVGQRIITKAFSDGNAERKADAKVSQSTIFGPAELVMDPVSDAKYSWLQKLGIVQPLMESPVNKISFASLHDVRTQLVRMHDLVEDWLRTGFYGEVSINSPNVNICQRPDADTRNAIREGMSPFDDEIHSSNSSSEDEDEVLDHQVCVDALEQAGTSISIALLHGGFAVHNFGISTFVASEKIFNTCADCDAKVDVMQGILFANNASACAMCDRPRCFKCSTKSLGKPRQQRCLRCTPEPLAKAQTRKKK